MRETCLILISLFLSSCAGTVVEMTGEVCGSPVAFRMVDNKDRSAADISVKCGQDGGVTVTTTDSTASAVMSAQANAIRGLTEELNRRVLP